jgi:hypothetical protein
MLSEKNQLLKNVNHLQSENSELKVQAELASEKDGAMGYRHEYLSRILIDVNKINSSHEFIFNSLKVSKKLVKG